jgi:hypothetical protein
MHEHISIIFNIEPIFDLSRVQLLLKNMLIHKILFETCRNNLCGICKEIQIIQFSFLLENPFHFLFLFIFSTPTSMLQSKNRWSSFLASDQRPTDTISIGRDHRQSRHGGHQEQHHIYLCPRYCGDP